MPGRSPDARGSGSRAGAVMLLRHLLAIALLPLVAVVLVPRWLLGDGAERLLESRPLILADALVRLAGVPLFLAGLGLAGWCVLLFAGVGQGTLAPWDPPRRLVIEGPYRHVRNPMICGVAAMIAGEALITASARIAGWFAFFVIVNHIYFVAVEEPRLALRFGSAYERYRSAVPRWLPSRRAWRDHAARGR